MHASPDGLGGRRTFSMSSRVISTRFRAWQFTAWTGASLHRLWWELLEWNAGVEPISHARSRRTVQVAQHDHRLARLRIHWKNRVHSRSAAAVAVGPRLVGPSELESEAVGACSQLRTRGVGERLGLQ